MDIAFVSFSQTTVDHGKSKSIGHVKNLGAVFFFLVFLVRDW